MSLENVQITIHTEHEIWPLAPCDYTGYFREFQLVQVTLFTLNHLINCLHFNYVTHITTSMKYHTLHFVLSVLILIQGSHPIVLNVSSPTCFREAHHSSSGHQQSIAEANPVHNHGH